VLSRCAKAVPFHDPGQDVIASKCKRLPKAKQRFVSEMLDNMLAQANACQADQQQRR